MNNRNFQKIPEVHLAQDRLLKEEEGKLEQYVAKNVSNDYDFTKIFLDPSMLSGGSSSSSPGVNTTMSCPGIDNSDPTTSETLIKYETTFDYEIVTPTDGSSLNEALKTLESRIMEETATGFLTCERRRDARDRNLQNKEESGQIVLIDSSPIDVEDKVNVECKRDTGVTAGGDVKCIPMIGAMTLYSDCPTCPYPEEEILSSIKSAFESGMIVDDDLVKQVNYVGPRNSASSIVRTTEFQDTVKLGKAKDSSVAMSWTLGFLVLGMIFTMLFVRNRVRRRNKHRELSRELADINIDIEDDDNEYGDRMRTSTMVNFNELAVQEEEEGINVSPMSNSFFANFW